MMEGLRSWLISLVTVSILCAAADTLMPEGGPKRVGKLLCGMLLLCAILKPLVRLDPEEGRRWLENWKREVEEQTLELEEEVDRAVKPVIETGYEAYIAKRAAELGLQVEDVSVETAAGEDGLALPVGVELTGHFEKTDRERLARTLAEDLGIPPDRIRFREEVPP